MSRTFRIRHLPSLPGTAKKFAFGVGSCYARRELLIRELAKKLAPEVVLESWFGRYHSRWQQGAARSVVEVLENQVVTPIAHPGTHPWVGYCCNIPVAKEYRKFAHHQMRHREKFLLNKSNVDFDEVIMPKFREYFNRWSVC